MNRLPKKTLLALALAASFPLAGAAYAGSLFSDIPSNTPAAQSGAGAFVDNTPDLVKQTSSANASRSATGSGSNSPDHSVDTSASGSGSGSPDHSVDTSSHSASDHSPDHGAFGGGYDGMGGDHGGGDHGGGSGGGSGGGHGGGDGGHGGDGEGGHGDD